MTYREDTPPSRPFLLKRRTCYLRLRRTLAIEGEAEAAADEVARAMRPRRVVSAISGDLLGMRTALKGHRANPHAGGIETDRRECGGGKRTLDRTRRQAPGGSLLTASAFRAEAELAWTLPRLRDAVRQIDATLVGVAGIQRVGVAVVAGRRRARKAHAARTLVADRAGIAVITDGAIQTAGHGDRRVEAALDRVAGVQRVGVAIVAVGHVARKAKTASAEVVHRTGIAVGARKVGIQDVRAARHRIAVVARAGVAIVAVAHDLTAHALAATALVAARADVAVRADHAVVGVFATRRRVAGVGGAGVVVVAA